MARLPQPISIPQHKSPGTVRIFVFGESAAYGDPQPRFGLSRMLEAILELRHPGTKFEVINTAMTGINSHTIVPIARDCAAANGDVWVIYMGNNEVVGPFGAGTVFGPQAPPLPVIRASLDLKATRTGQLFDSVAGSFRAPPPSKSEWGGMSMFLDQRIRSDDPRMRNVYRNFDRNLADIIKAGREKGAGIVVSTVAVNLKDCAPFASLHRANFSVVQLADWDAAVKSGVAAGGAGDWQRAWSEFSRAEEEDDTYAELRFRMGQCSLALGRTEEAVEQFAAARDLDALRFRCDKRLNEIIRQATANHADEKILLVDSERAFAEASPNGLPGADLFYEHVHLNFRGHYLLANGIARQVEQLLPPTVTPAKGNWPEISDCAKRLARTDRDAQLAYSDILGRLADPPFSGQLNHVEQVHHLDELSRNLAPANSTAALQDAQTACESAILRFPEDPLLHQQLAELKQALTDHAGAAKEAEHSLELLPRNSEAFLLLGLALAQQQKYEEASAALQQAFTLDSQDVWARQNFAICLQKMGRKNEAMQEFKQALAIKPRFGLAWLGLGQLYEETGKTNEAAACYRSALANPIHRADELTTLARFCQSRKWFEAASTNYLEAIKLSPSDANLRVEAGQSLAMLARHVEAAECFAEACRLSPQWGQAHFLCGLEYGRLAKPGDAEREFREAVRLLPELVEARLNLGIALYQQQKLQAAAEVFHETLQRDPANATALKYQAVLRQRLALESGE